ncbi:MAG: ATP-binding protein [Candidatus Omnitrophica bacterium]|nr:ATP-binding protein [Candidatus Omnitrophota bacterium]
MAEDKPDRNTALFFTMNRDSFFDREQLTGLLKKRITDAREGYRQNIALLGEESVGKTSLIFKLIGGFNNRNTLFLYLETRPETIDSFARRFMGVLLYNFLSDGSTPLKEDIAYLIEKAASRIPKTIVRIKAILADLEKRKKENIFGELLSLCDSLRQETHTMCVVIFDEFQNLESIGSKNIFKEWAGQLVSQKNTMYIIISSLPVKAQNILSKELSLLFGNFEVIAVEPFDLKTTEHYLEQRLKNLDLSRGHRNFIAHFTGGIPFYLHTISESLIRSPHTNITVILDDLLFNTQGILHQKFSGYLKRFLDAPHGSEYAFILHLIAEGHNKCRDIVNLTRKPKEKILGILNSLTEQGMLTRNGDFFILSDRVFGFWIRFVHQGKMHSFTFDAKNQNAIFHKKVEGILQEYLENEDKPLMERIEELLHLFGNDLIHIERKKIRLSHFREIKPLELNGRGMREGLICRSNDRVWLFAFKNELLTEEDITEFSKECRKYRKKLECKIIIALKDIDSNSRLRALEEKILTWDVNSLNQIMDLFFKPRVIV